MNFIQGNTAQNGVWSSILLISSQEDSKEVYFVFFQILFSFIGILEVYKSFWKCYIGKQNSLKKKKSPE
jgi:hypothetical protein